MGGRERAVSELYTTDSEVRDLGMVIESFPAVKRERYKARGEGCARCRYRLVCDGVWREYAELFGTGELSPVLGPVVTGAGRPPGAPPC
jgi:hypothetical protein